MIRALGAAGATQTPWGNSGRSALARTDPVATLAATLFRQAHGIDRHAPVHRLAHVVERQAGGAHPHQRLHFDARSRLSPRNGLHADTAPLPIDVEIDLDGV